KQHATDADIAEAYETACRKIDASIERLKEPVQHNTQRNPIPAEVEMGTIQSNITKDQFIDNVNRAKEYIRAGDIFQVVLSQRFHIETSISPLHVYRVL